MGRDRLRGICGIWLGLVKRVLSSIEQGADAGQCGTRRLAPGDEGNEFELLRQAGLDPDNPDDVENWATTFGQGHLPQPEN